MRRFTPILIDASRPCRRAVGDRLSVDETYVKVAGVWRCVYRAVDQYGQVLDVFVLRRRDGAAATWFFAKALRAFVQNIRRGTTSSTTTTIRPRESRRRSTTSAQRSSTDATVATRRQRAATPVNATVPLERERSLRGSTLRPWRAGGGQAQTRVAL